jgi:uncharacterized OB-fold protein
VKPKQPAAPGWFTLDDPAPRLIGSRCRACGTYFFPKETFFCRNPACASSELEEVPLSPRGRLWSYTNNCYAPPPPFVASDPFQPYAVAAVELEKERMVVLGQVEAGVGVEQLEVGMEMELALGTLFEDAEREVVIWKWRPVASEGRA